MKRGMVEEVIGTVRGTGGDYAVVIVYGAAKEEVGE